MFGATVRFETFVSQPQRYVLSFRIAFQATVQVLGNLRDPRSRLVLSTEGFGPLLGRTSDSTEQKHNALALSPFEYQTPNKLLRLMYREILVPKVELLLHDWEANLLANVIYIRDLYCARATD